MKVLKPLPHAVIDYAWAAKMIASPWLLGFSENKTATMSAVGSGAAIAGLSLMTRYPLGAVKWIPFPAHGVIEAMAGVTNLAAPWLMGFAGNKRAKWLHVISGLSTLAVVAMTDYQAAERPATNQSRHTRARGEIRPMRQAYGVAGGAAGQERNRFSEVA